MLFHNAFSILSHLWQVVILILVPLGTIKYQSLLIAKFSTTIVSIILFSDDSSSPLKVGLKAECELWLHLINEMKTGRILSRGI